MNNPIRIKFSIEPWIREGEDEPKRIVLEKIIQNDEHFDSAFDEFIVCAKKSLKRSAEEMK